MSDIFPGRYHSRHRTDAGQTPGGVHRGEKKSKWYSSASRNAIDDLNSAIWSDGPYLQHRVVGFCVSRQTRIRKRSMRFSRSDCRRTGAQKHSKWPFSATRNAINDLNSAPWSDGWHLQHSIVGFRVSWQTRTQIRSMRFFLAPRADTYIVLFLVSDEQGTHAPIEPIRSRCRGWTELLLELLWLLLQWLDLSQSGFSSHKFRL